MSLLLPLIALLGFSPEAPADAIFEVVDEDYVACIEGLATNPEAVRSRAAKWRSEGGGAAALYCQAVGDLAGGYAKLAAVRLEELAERPDAGDALVRAKILSQAAMAWLDAGEIDLAEKAIDAAFRHAPEGGELYLAAARVRLASEDYQATIEAVDAAEREGYRSPAGYVARARARLALTDNRGAAEDVVEALQLDPLNVDALVVRGELAQRGIDIHADYARAPE